MARLLQKLSDILRAPRFGVLWAEAQDLASRGENARALAALSEGYALFGWPKPSEAATIAANMTLALVWLGLENYEEALMAADTIRRQVSKPEMRVSPEDSLFILAFCAGVGRSAGHGLGGRPENELVEGISRIDDSVMARVSSKYRLNFSLQAADVPKSAN